MRGRDFFRPARTLLAGSTEADWRASAVFAYYALFLECRDALTRWGAGVPRQPNVHAAVRLRLLYAGDADLKAIGNTLDHLVQIRNRANYDLLPSVEFSTSAQARKALRQAEDALALLDTLEADPARRAAAIASLPP